MFTRRARAALAALLLLGSSLFATTPTTASHDRPPTVQATTQASPADTCDTLGGGYNKQAQKASTHSYNGYNRTGIKANFDPWGSYFSRCDGIGIGDPQGFGATYAWVGFGDYTGAPYRIIQLGLVDCRTSALHPLYTGDPCGKGDPAEGLRYAYAYGGNCPGYVTPPIVKELPGTPGVQMHNYEITYSALWGWRLYIDVNLVKTIELDDPIIACWAATMSNTNLQAIVSAEIQDIDDQPGDPTHKSSFKNINTFWNGSWHTVDWSTCSEDAPMQCSIGVNGGYGNQMYVWAD